MIKRYRLTSKSWVPITVAGQTADVWVEKNLKGSTDVILNHSEYVPTKRYGFSIFEKSGNKGYYSFVPKNQNDVLYARLLANNCELLLLVDVRDYNKAEVSKDNSSTTLLKAGETFTGDAIEVLNYGIVFVNVYSDVDSATDGLRIEGSIDCVAWRHSDVFSISGGSAKNFSINPYIKYMRVKYTNGASDQTVFELQTILKANSKPSSHRIQDSISTDDDAELVKAVLTGENPNGDFVNYGATKNGNFKVAVQEYGDTPSIDAFGKLRTSNPYTIFDSKQLHDKQPLFWDEIASGLATSTHNSIDSCVEMSVTASASDSVIRQTKQRFNYQPGKSQLILMTFQIPIVEGITARIGIFDGTGSGYLTPNNGIFFECDGDVSWNIAKNGSITESVIQDNWNVDPLDGTGPSGKTLDLDAAQILIIDYEWLGVGRVRVGFVIDGLIYYCHYFNHANDPTFDSVYMSTPNLPLRYSIETDGSNACTLNHICSTVMSEGGLEETGILRSVDTGTTPLAASVADTTYAVIGIRLKATYKDVTVRPEYFSMISETPDGFRWSIQLNPTIDDIFNYSDVLNSAIQKAIGVTANDITAEGLVIDSGYVPPGSVASGAEISRKIITALRLGATIAGVQDTLVLAVTPLGANAEIQASLTIRELL